MRHKFLLSISFILVGLYFPFSVSAGSLNIRSIGPDGNVLPRANQTYVSTLDYEPVAVTGTYDTTKTLSNLPDVPVMFSAYVEIPNYGKLDFIGFGNGQGFTPNNQTLDVLYEIAKTRLLLTQTYLQENMGYPSEYTQQLQQAKVFFDQATAAPGGTAQQAQLALESLKIAAPLSEKVVVFKNKKLLENKNKLNSDQFVSLFSFYRNREGVQKFDNLIAPLKAGLVPYVQWQSHIGGGQISWPEMSVTGMGSGYKNMRMVPGAWFNALPSSYASNVPKIKTDLTDFMTQAVTRYPKVKYWQILSEPHTWDDQGFLTVDNLLDIAGSVNTSMKQVNPNIKTGINTTLAWGEDRAFNLSRTPQVTAPYTFYKKAKDAGINYDFMVLQLYPSGRDMFETNLLIERFHTLDKDIHIELSAPSKNIAMPNETRPEYCQGTSDCRHPAQKYYSWHGDWSEATQSEWLEYMFYVLMSKPYVKEFNWWDLADYQDVYVPWSGLMNADYTPKPSYTKLVSLVQRFPSSLPQDLNSTGSVDIFDYNLLVADFNKTFSEADFNHNSSVDIFDYNLLISSFGKNI